MRVQTSRVVIWGAALLVLAAVGAALRPGAVPVDLASVQRGPLQVTIDEEGETRVRNRYMVSAPLPGRVLRIDLEPGDPVTADETVLATFEPADPVLLDSRARAEAEARVRAAQAAVERTRAQRTGAEAARDFAQSEAERYQQLADNGLVSKDRLESAQVEARTRTEALRAAEFAVTTAEHELEVARASLLQARGGSAGGTMVLRSPIDGVVLQRLRESEAVVPSGAPLLEIADPSQLEIVSDMLSADAVKIEAGDQVLIDQWGGDAVLRGRVRRVEPFGFTKVSALGVEEQRVNVIVDFEDPREAWKALGDGYRVEVRVVIWEGDDVLQVPTSGLFRDGDAWAVFLVEGGTVALRHVEVGQRTGLAAQIVSGLEASDQIVVHPSDDVRDGVRVEVRGT